MLSYSPAALIDFALPKWEADPNARIEDAYKWLYQATRGGEHMVLNLKVTSEALEKEWLSLGTARDGELLWEPLSPDEKIGRINVRPFKGRGGNMGNLVDAFIASSEAYSSSPESFLNAWNELGCRLDTRLDSPLDHSKWSRLDDDMKGKNYPAISHSDVYRAARHPSYRILTAEEAKQLINELATVATLQR